MTTVDDRIEVDCPINTVYNQWTQFEEFPHFMDGIESVVQIDDTRLHWAASIGGVKREWDARIVQQKPDELVSWENVDGATNRGVVSFRPLDTDRTEVSLHLEFEPEGIVEQVGDKLGIVGGKAKGDLERFKEFIESRHTETGAWRGQVEGGVER